MEAKMIIATGRNAGTQIPLKAPRLFIGRAHDCQFRPHNDSVARHHCVVLVEHDFLAVRDLGSKQGTFVNGDRITGERELKHGDRVRVGELELEVRLDVPAGEEGSEPPARQGTSADMTDSPQEEDLDLDHWLTDSGAQDPADTERPGMGSAGGPASGNPEPESPDEDQKKKKRKKEEKPVDVPGVWKKGQWKPTSVDPSQAAADTLKDFFKRP